MHECVSILQATKVSGNVRRTGCTGSRFHLPRSYYVSCSIGFCKQDVK